MYGKPLTILLVEDNPGDARLLREYVAEVETVPSTMVVHVTRLHDALQRLAAERFDVVLLDLSLPDSQGLDTCISVSTHAPGVPIVVLTGFDDETLAINAMQAGAQDYLVKGQIEGHLLRRAMRYAIERERTEHTLRQHEEQLRQVQKMEAIGRLAGGVAHDFNNLLTAILGYSELLLMHLGETQPLRRYAEEISKTTERAATLTRQLLAFSRRQVLQPQILDFNTVVANMEGMLRRLIGEDVELITVPQPGLGQVKADPGQMEQVIMNLAVNARDAMPHGGKLIIETEVVELADAYMHRHAEVHPGLYVMLAVSDTGYGMDEATQARIFEPFFTTKDQGKGTGLGLATVYGIVKQSSGYIWVYSEPAQGSTFKIYLPCVEEASARMLVSHPTAPRSLVGSETVLVVEDQTEVRLLIDESLRRYGYTVLQARDGAEALRVCERYQDPIHLLVTDVVMPQISGRELAERIVSMRPQIQVLYVSGYTNNVITHHGILTPGTAFLQKPFTPDALAGKIRELLEAP